MAKQRGSKLAQPPVIEVSSIDLKNAWNQYLARVEQMGQELVVSHYGRRIARLVPYEPSEAEQGIFGCLSGTVTVHGDIISTGEDWAADRR